MLRFVMRWVMRTTDLLLRQVRHALAAAFVLGGVAAVLQVLLPLCALHVIDTAVPSQSVETLALLATLAGGGLAAFACIEAARARILIRAGLWLDHTLGSHVLEDSLAREANAEEIEADAAALTQLREACTGGSLRASLDAPWLALQAVVLCLLDWRLGAPASAAVLVMAGRAALAYRNLQSKREHAARAALRAGSWLQSITRMSGLSRIPQSAAEQWERLNREHVASAYPLLLQGAHLADFARAARLAAQIGVLGLGAWLVMRGEVTLGTLVAALLLTWRLLEPLESVLSSLASAAGLRQAWHRIANRPKAAIGQPAPRSESALPPRLHIAGPLAAGCAAAALFFVLFVGTAAATRVGWLVAVAGQPLFDTRLADVFPQRRGLSAHVHVSEGARVNKGDVLATLDTKSLDARIVSLKLQASTAQIELSTLNREIAELSVPGAPGLKTRAQLEKLEGRIDLLGRQGKDLQAKIVAAESELAQSRIVAPISGQVLSLAAKPGMPVETDMPLATLITSDSTLLARLLAPLRVDGLFARILGVTAAQANESGKD